MARLALALAVLAVVAGAAAEEAAQSSYIVHVTAEHERQLSRSRPRRLARAYGRFLREQIPAELLHPAPRVLYAYSLAATGFAARLTEQQAAHLASSSPAVLAVIPDAGARLHTTLTPFFLGLTGKSYLLEQSGGATDVVIGVIDTGVYPINHPAFMADPSLPPPPSKFRGRCVSTPSFNTSAYCNNKLVGARFFSKGPEAGLGRPLDESFSFSPLDTDGHGTHTASTAAGSRFSGANLFGYAAGEAVGAAPGARIAVYKACWGSRCLDPDLLAAVESAIADGVDIISLSVGRGKPIEFHRDAIATGAFRAVRKGILVCASAGNEGPAESTVVNVPPWILTVGASTVNRQFAADVLLGNGATFRGASLYDGLPLGTTVLLPLVSGSDAGSSLCLAGLLDPAKVAGKIVLCVAGEISQVEKSEAVYKAGGAGAILAAREDYGLHTDPAAHLLAAASVTYADANKIRQYMGTTAHPIATILFRGTVVSTTPSSPRMAYFSSRGPSVVAPQILKPDITAPGVHILAAWTGLRAPSDLPHDRRRSWYNIISGTSMSCPHVSGVAAMVRQARPGWSPAAIKSALMTTAYNVDSAGYDIRDRSTGLPSTPFALGAGHVNPNRAISPGMVYDAGAEDYISFMCTLGYTAQQISIVTGESTVDCTSDAAAGDLNYPSFSVIFRSGQRSAAVTQRRVARNFIFGGRGETFNATITSPRGVLVSVNPPLLQFGRMRRTVSYEITFTPTGDLPDSEMHTFGSITWSSFSCPRVRSPIAVTWLTPPALKNLTHAETM